MAVASLRVELASFVAVYVRRGWPRAVLVLAEAEGPSR